VPLALVEHAIWDRPGWPGSLTTSTTSAALALGSGIGVLVSFILWYLGFLPTSFADGGPLLEVDKAKLAESDAPPEREYSSSEIRAEMRKEMLFLMPPLGLGFLWVLLVWKVPALTAWWDEIASIGWVGGLLGSVLGMLVGGLVVWMARILGSYGFGREAMGLGDVHLMAAVGAVLGPGPATVAFFIAPFVGIPKAIVMLFLKKGRELPLGPYLSVGTAIAMLFYNPIANYLSPGLSGLMMLISSMFSGSSRLTG
jgi:leader peptidase (prepilin peptidase) / N-methyltransferase